MIMKMCSSCRALEGDSEYKSCVIIVPSQAVNDGGDVPLLQLEGNSEYKLCVIIVPSQAVNDDDVPLL